MIRVAITHVLSPLIDSPFVNRSVIISPTMVVTKATPPIRYGALLRAIFMINGLRMVVARLNITTATKNEESLMLKLSSSTEATRRPMALASKDKTNRASRRSIILHSLCGLLCADRQSLPRAARLQDVYPVDRGDAYDYNLNQFSKIKNKMTRKTKICIGCQRLFEARRDAKTCSPRCRKRYQRAREHYYEAKSLSWQRSRTASKV